MIYFIQIETSGPIKIGYARGSIARRVKTLSTASPWDLHVIGQVFGEIEHEKYLHRELKQHRLRHEWFHPHPDVFAMLSKVMDKSWQWPTSTQLTESAAALTRAIEIAGGQASLGRKIGKSQGHVWAWLKSGRVPAHFAAPIERATDGAVTRADLRPDLFEPISPDRAEALRQGIG